MTTETILLIGAAAIGLLALSKCPAEYGGPDLSAGGTSDRARCTLATPVPSAAALLESENAA
jgi:hypothetical protein